MDKHERNGGMPQFNPNTPPLPQSLLVSPFAKPVDDDDFDLRRLLSVLRRRALLVAGVTTISMGLIVAHTLTQPRIYVAKFRLLVEPVNSDSSVSDLAQNLQQGSGANPSGELDYNTQIQVLRSPELLQQVVQPLKGLYPEMSYALLAQNLIITRPGDTKILEVSYQSDDPDQIEDVLEQVASVYLDYSLADRQTNLRQGIQFIDQQLPALQEQVNALQEELQQFRQTYNFIEPDVQAGQLSQQATALEQQRLQLEQEAAQAQAYFQSIQQENGSLAVLKDAAVYQQLIGELRSVEANIARESTRFQEDSLNIRVLEEERQNLLPVLREEAQRVGETQLADAITQLQILQARSQALNQAQAQLDQALGDLPALSRRYADLQRELQIATEGLTQFLANRQALEIQAAQTEIPWQVIEAPTRPGAPISPNIQRSLILGLIASSILGVGLALLLEKLNDVYHSAEELKTATKLPLLSTVPYQKQYETVEEDRVLSPIDRFKLQIERLIPASVKGTLNGATSSGDSYTSYGYHGSSQFSEALRVLYTNLRLSSADRPLRSIIITSALPEDGKSTVALNLAQTTAILGQRVLLVDADMRRPQISKRLNLPNIDGLSSVISSDKAFSSCLQKPISLVDFSILPSGATPPDPAKLLTSQKMKRLMKEVSDEFDLVVYDTPPTIGLADVILLAPHTDGVVLVVSLDKTERSAVTQAIASLKQANIPILGVVANKETNGTSTKYHYHYYGSGGLSKREQQVEISNSQDENSTGRW